MTYQKEIISIKRSTRRWLIFFMVSLIISGATAFDVRSGLQFLHEHIHSPALANWIAMVYTAITETTDKYPFLFYGYDWLAFAHIVIAIAFIGPCKDPVKNEWVVEFGMIACALVIPAAFIMGAARHIPMWWLFVDCSFGIIGFIPLYITWLRIKQIKKLLALDNMASQQSEVVPQILTPENYRHENKNDTAGAY